MYLNMKGKFKKNTMSDKKGERRFEVKLWMVTCIGNMFSVKFSLKQLQVH